MSVSIQQENKLLQSIKALYTRITKLIYSLRIRAYRKRPAKSPNATVITKTIERIALSDGDNTDPPKPSSSLEMASATRSSTPVKLKLTRLFNELSRRFRSHRTGAVAQPVMARKMCDSVEKHLHTAVRFARQGDRYAARVHAGIAESALEEAGHYMSQEEFSRFHDEMVKKLDSFHRF